MNTGVSGAAALILDRSPEATPDQVKALSDTAETVSLQAGDTVFLFTDGIEEAKQIPGIEDITITVAAGRHVEMLPEGDRYLGFVFAGGTDPQSVEDSLRRAANELSVTIDGEGFTVTGQVGSVERVCVWLLVLDG